MKIYRVFEVLQELDTCIKKKEPFSLIRFGDGGLKFLYSMLTDNEKQLKGISKREGIPVDKMEFVLTEWQKYANQANFIDSPEVYFHDEFWPRLKHSLKNKKMSEETLYKLKNWKKIYENSGFINERFCNPEINYLSIIRMGRKNLFDIMTYRKICLITANTSTGLILSQSGQDITTLKIVGQHRDHYKNSFPQATRKIKLMANEFDLWLVAAGELGRIYSGMIKEYGGRAFDIGFVVDFWSGFELHDRLIKFLQRNPKNKLELVLTDDSKKYKQFI